ncbi:MAG: hypothetical protein ISR61_01665 [Desulfobacteraceae bacterium]|uniref:Uncharacterized protein n=1 Tax=Candidatus Desulfacyla euxinica TaxID=2841693 RepID=A0A8J6N3K3_9DELT|nr:hypothetical protein [Candidatus Desulfacyla euxinica]MBL6977625.1 hypothetical protein [Desulfobacteraceae bacterium]MBL7216212.1 hypothetical protein [Desulfobacteraceae bacterium]
MQNFKRGQALLFGKRNNKVKEIERILKRYTLGVKLVSETGPHVEPDQGSAFSLIVVTDSIGDKVDKNYIAKLRQSFPQAKVLSLFDDMNPEIEMNMRSAGLIFLGSYEHFIKESADIIASAFGSKKAVNNFSEN